MGFSRHAARLRLAFLAIGLPAVLLAVPALAQTPQPSLEAQFVAGLLLRDERDIARLVSDRYVAGAEGKAEAIERRRELSRALLGAAQMQVAYRLSPDEDLALRNTILEWAGEFTEKAGKADPKVAKTQDFRTEVAMLKQRRAQLIAQVLPRISNPAKAESFREEARKLFGEAANIYEGISKEQGAAVRKLENQVPPEDAEACKKWEGEVDEKDGMWGATRLRAAICTYQLALLEGSGTRKDKILNQLDKDFVDIEFRYSFYQFVAHIHYYWGLTKLEMGKPDKAVEQFAKGIASEDTPTDVRYLCHHGRTKARVQLGLFKDALRDVELMVRGALPAFRDRFVADRVVVNAEWAVDLLGDDKLEDAGKRFSLALADARELLRIGSATRTRAMKAVVDATKSGKGAFEIDHTVLEAVADMARRDEEWAEAGDSYRQLTATAGIPRETRDTAAYYLAYCYHKQDRLLEAALAASWAADTCSKDYRYLADADTLAVSSCAKLANAETSREEDLPFFKKWLTTERLLSQQRPIEKRTRRDNPQYTLAYGFEGEKNYGRAIAEYQKIKPGDIHYDKAVFRIGECHWQLARIEAGKRNLFGAATGMVKARNAFGAALDYLQKNPGESPEDKQARRGLTGKIIFRLASIEADRSALQYGQERIRSARGAKLMDVVKETAGMMGADAGGLGNIDTRKKADAALNGLYGKRLRKAIALTDRFTVTYKSLDAYFPFVHFMRLTAFVELAEHAQAEKEAEALQAHPKTGKPLLDKIYDRLGLIHYHLGRSKLGSAVPGEREEGVQHMQKALKFTLLRIEAGGQSYDVYSFLSALASEYCPEELLGRTITVLVTGLEKAGDKELKKRSTRTLAYVLANLQLQAGQPEEALKSYKDLDSRIEAILKENPNDKAGDMQRVVKRGLADGYRTAGKYKEAIDLYNVIGRNLPKGKEDWWNIIYRVAQCNALWGKHHDAYQMVAAVHNVRPSMGGPERRQKFIAIFDDTTADKVKDRALKAKIKTMVDAMKQYKDTTEVKQD